MLPGSRAKDPRRTFKTCLLSISQEIPEKKLADLKTFFQPDTDISEQRMDVRQEDAFGDCTSFQFLMALERREAIKPTDTSALHEPLEALGLQLEAAKLRKSDQEELQHLNNTDGQSSCVCQPVAIREPHTSVTDTANFNVWWSDMNPERPCCVSSYVPPCHKELMMCLFTAQPIKLLQSVRRECSKLSLFHEGISNVIRISLEDGLFFELPSIDASGAQGGELMLQMTMEALLLLSNAGELIDKVRQCMPSFPQPLYLLYKAKWASMHGFRDVCKTIFDECLSCLSVLAKCSNAKHSSWIYDALGLTIRHIEPDFVIALKKKIGYHSTAYSLREDCTPSDELDGLMQQMELARNKQSLGFAQAYAGIVGKFAASTKLEYHNEALSNHGKAVKRASDVQSAVGMKGGMASPSNFALTLRFDGVLRHLRIRQTKLKMLEGSFSEAEFRNRIEQQVMLVEGEKQRTISIAENPCVQIDKYLIQRMSAEYDKLAENVKKFVIQGFTINHSSHSE